MLFEDAEKGILNHENDEEEKKGMYLWMRVFLIINNNNNMDIYQIEGNLT